MSELIDEKLAYAAELEAFIEDLYAAEGDNPDLNRAAQFMESEFYGQPDRVDDGSVWYQYPRTANPEATRLYIELARSADGQINARAWRYEGSILGDDDPDGELMRAKFTRSTSPYELGSLAAFLFENKESPAHDWCPGASQL